MIPRADVIAHQELIVAREIVTQLESRLNFLYFSAGFLKKKFCLKVKFHFTAWFFSATGILLKELVRF